MKFAERSPAERTAISAWIRVLVNVREDWNLPLAEDFRQVREKSISESPAEVEKLVRLYAAYQAGRNSISYPDYFQVSNPEEYAAMTVEEKLRH